MKIKFLTLFTIALIMGIYGYRYFQQWNELTEDEGQQEFIYAVEHNDSNKVMEALKSGINLNQPIDDRLPLVVACEKGHEQIADLLLKGGANINLELSPGKTALFTAVEMKHSSMIGYLLKAGADPTLRLPNGWTLLHSLAYQGRKSDLKIFLDFMRASGKKIDLRDKHGITPLMYAAANGHTKVVQLLMLHGSDPNAKSITGMTPLLFLASSHRIHHQTALYLVNNGANLNLVDRDGITPLMAAAHRNHEPLVVLFQSKGADKGLKNKAGKTAFDIAFRLGNRQIASYLK